MTSQPPDSSGFDLGDIYFALFRHKWKVLGCAIAGLIAAGAYYKLKPPPAQSVAKLLVLYVFNGEKTVGPAAGDQSLTKSPDMRGETIMESEQEIITSLDLAKQVAEQIGPERILAKLGGGKDLMTAAIAVRDRIRVEVVPRSSVIWITFSHPDVNIVQPVLKELVTRYQTMHKEIHEPGGFVGDFLSQERDHYRQLLLNTEQELATLQSKAGVVSVNDAKTTLSTHLEKIREEILNTEADIADRATVLSQLSKAAPRNDAPGDKPSDVSPAKVAEYAAAVAKTERARTYEQELLKDFTPEVPRVRAAHEQLVEAQAAQAKLEQENPSLGRTPSPASPDSSTGPNSQQSVARDLLLQSATLAGLQDRVKILNAQQDGLRNQINDLEQLSLRINDLNREKEREQTSYTYYANQVEQNLVNEALTGGKIQNINPVQNATPAYVDYSKSYKVVAMIAVGGVAAGLAWAFLIEFYLDRSIRRPKDVERLLGIPLFLAIPEMNRRKALLARKKREELDQPVDHPLANATIVPWDNKSELHQFHETLRDRLIGYFESRNLTHKPKLVAVTGLAKKSGVSTTAAGLASCLSDTGQGNVLLVDLTPGGSSSHQFYRGKPVCDIDELLSTRDNAQVQANLYVVTETGGTEKLSRVLPQRFSKLVPQLKASDFDYIIFDMPPVSQISITPRLAGFMDMVLMVIESEHNHRDVVQRAVALLAESKAHVGAVLNKTKTYVPTRLHQEYLGNA